MADRGYSGQSAPVVGKSRGEKREFPMGSAP